MMKVCLTFSVSTGKIVCLMESSSESQETPKLVR